MYDLYISGAVWNGERNMAATTATRWTIASVALCALTKYTRGVIQDIAYCGFAVVRPVLMVPDVDDTCLYILFYILISV